ncbi:MAG TPA: TonB-dependent receptor [Bacteroidales bacterium]|nr:TonB-dependent receptor [Bacteroidales bacterium]
MNKQNSPHLKKFRSQDIGLNFHYTISNHLSANTYSYFINDNYNAKNLFYNYAGNIHFNKKRYFNVFNVKYIMNNIVVEFNNEFNVSNLHYRFGIIREDTKVNQFYNVVDMKYLPNGHISFTLGITDGLFIDKFTNTLPQNYYSIHPEDPSYGFRHREKNLNIETYGYVRYTAPKVAIGAGFRKNLSIKNQESYLSYQGNLRYTFISQSSVHISAGKYNGYTVPSFYIQQFNHVSAVQYAIGYRYKSNNSTFGISVYKKREIFPKYFKDVGRGQQTTKDIKGLEISTQYQMRHFLFSASYTWLDSKFKKGVQWIKSSNSMNYLVKLSLSHTSIKHLNFSINYITRPGHFYTPIINGEKISKTRGFKPVFGTYNAQQLNSYSRIDLTANKVISYNNLSIIPFFTLTNILNNENQRTPVYSRDYGKISNYWYYEKRLIYFGVQVSF